MKNTLKYYNLCNILRGNWYPIKLYLHEVYIQSYDLAVKVNLVMSAGIYHFGTVPLTDIRSEKVG